MSVAKAKVTVEVERAKLLPMGELAPVAPEFPKKPYNRFLGNPPEHATAQEAYADEMGIEKPPDKPEIEPPVLVHETVHGHEAQAEHNKGTEKTKK